MSGRGFTGASEDFGIEGANNPASFDALPRATPTLANYTFLGNGGGSAGIQFKQGSGGRIFNTIVDGFKGACVRWDNAPSTYNAAGTPAAPNADVSALNGLIINCTNSFQDSGGAPYPVGDFFNSSAFKNNLIGNPGLDVYMPTSNSPALTGGVGINDNQFFDYTTYRGGFDGRNDWTIGWTHQVLGGE